MEAFQGLGHYVHILIIRPERKTPNISKFLEKGIEVTEIHPPQIPNN